jgi:hypothetical protein
MYQPYAFSGQIPPLNSVFRDSPDSLSSECPQTSAQYRWSAPQPPYNSLTTTYGNHILSVSSSHYADPNRPNCSSTTSMQNGVMFSRDWSTPAAMPMTYSLLSAPPPPPLLGWGSVSFVCHGLLHRKNTGNSPKSEKGNGLIHVNQVEKAEWMKLGRTVVNDLAKKSESECRPRHLSMGSSRKSS